MNCAMLDTPASITKSNGIVFGLLALLNTMFNAPNIDLFTSIDFYDSRELKPRATASWSLTRIVEACYGICTFEKNFMYYEDSLIIRSMKTDFLLISSTSFLSNEPTKLSRS